ncbi:MAG: hypothetical protein FJY11_00995 [Bacteroidetes bacterium]|nr:hypothetical protein [Bacteroidota bacterium]
MRLTKRYITPLLILLVWQYAPAQFYDTGTDPASLRWREIRTAGFRVVFPEGHERQAGLTADYLRKSMDELEQLYKMPPKRFRTDVVLHPFSFESNGYVGYAPRRMELFPMPDQNSLPADNLKLLTLHEAVHVVQFMSLQQGFNGVASRLGGQQFTGLTAALMPFWFYEGDAVLYETLLSPAGRGNNPSFNKDLKALYTSVPGGYSFNKMLLGSYRDYTPNHYMYGFRIMEYSRAKYGNDLWRNSLAFTAARPYLLNPLNVHLSKSASLSKKKLFEQTFTELSRLWHYDLQAEAPVQYTSISSYNKGDYANYFSPVFVGQDSIAVLKSSFSSPSSIVLLTADGEEERVLGFTGYLPDQVISAGGGKIVWSQFQPDPRWENRNYSSVYMLETATGTIRSLITASRLSSPAISSDGSKMAAVENSVMNENHLVLIDPATGQITRRIPTPQNGFAQRPQWADDTLSVTVILLTDKGEGVFTYSLKEDSWVCNIEPAYNDLQQALVRNDTTFFISSSGGTDNLFMKLPGGTIRKVTGSAYGVGSFSISGVTVVLSDYSHNGFRAVITGIESVDVNYHDPYRPAASFLDKIEVQATPDREEAVTVLYESAPYRKWLNILNIHSWVPLYFDLDEVNSNPSAVTPGFTLFSQNLLSTVTATAGYEYSGGAHRFHTGFTWKGWYPVVKFSASYGGDPQIIRGSTTGVNPSVIVPDIELKTETYVPLTFSRGAYTQYLRPSVSHRYRNRYIYQEELDQFDYGQVFLTGGFYFSNSRRSAYRDIFPRFAQAIDYAYTASPFDSELYGPVSSLRTAFYFPGILKNHGLRVRLQTESQVPEKFIQFNRIGFPRGYSGIISEKLETFSADYVFPIAYPDISAGSILYVKRFRGGMFVDASKGRRNRYIETSRFNPGPEMFSSFGGELIADFNILRIPFDISAGVRGIYLPSEGRSVAEAIFSVDVYGFSLGKGKRERLPWL